MQRHYAPYEHGVYVLYTHHNAPELAAAILLTDGWSGPLKPPKPLSWHFLGILGDS
jgi:hypothetical protein